MCVARYTVWIEETGPADMRAVEAFRSIPGYVEHEWIDYENSDLIDKVVAIYRDNG